MCTICGKTHAQKIHCQNHLESIHFPDMFIYSCSQCGKTFNGKNKLYVHVSLIHKVWCIYFMSSWIWDGSMRMDVWQKLKSLMLKYYKVYNIAGRLSMTVFYEYIVKDPENGPKMHKCTICGKQGSDRGNLRKHVENIHFPGTLSYQCKYCTETFTTRNGLNHHFSKMHKSVWYEISIN